MKVGAVGNSLELSTASPPVRASASSINPQPGHGRVVGLAGTCNPLLPGASRFACKPDVSFWRTSLAACLQPEQLPEEPTSHVQGGAMMRLPNRTSDAPLTMGVHVAKATLEVGLSDRNATLALSNDDVGHEALLAHLSELRARGLT